MLIIDNYDSFTYNIVQYVKMLGITPTVIKNDEKSLAEIKQQHFASILLGPGWGTPNNAGITLEVLDYYHGKCPILGICLGMQCIAQYYHGEIIKAPIPVHGKNSSIYYQEDFQLFAGFQQGFSATRYHSLMVKTNTRATNNAPLEFFLKEEKLDLSCTVVPKITAWTENDIPMALEVPNQLIFGVQFHPEAILTEHGLDIFKRFQTIVHNQS